MRFHDGITDIAAGLLRLCFRSLRRERKPVFKVLTPETINKVYTLFKEENISVVISVQS